jgi:hypothetical protein
MSIFKNLFKKEKKGPSTAELMREQERAASAERERIAREESERKMAADQKAVTDLQEAESRRRAFAGQLAEDGDEEERRRFLKGA